MGVSGSGKSTVAEGLAEKLGIAFIEGDKLHPKSKFQKGPVRWSVSAE
jgi:gluconokinase